MEYELTRRRGMRYIRLSVHDDGRLLVSAALTTSVRDIENFIIEKKVWIQKQRQKLDSEKHTHPILFSRSRYLANKEAARAVVASRVGFLNDHFDYSVERIAIKDQKTLWGSCSSKGNLNFNYRLLFLPIHLQEYVVVHELCHLKEQNHSRRFWGLVESVLPDYKKRDRELRRYEYLLKY